MGSSRAAAAARYRLDSGRLHLVIEDDQGPVVPGVRRRHARPDQWGRQPVSIDAEDFHVYAVEWTPGRAAFFVDDEMLTVVDQAPAYPMQFMLGLHAFPDEDGSLPPPSSPREFVVDWFHAYRRGEP